MILFAYISILLFLSCFENYQCDEDYLKVKIEDIEVEFVNETYYDVNTFDLSVIYKPDSRNNVRIYINLIEDLPSELYVKLKLWGRGFGQYNIPTGVSMDMNICNNKLKDYLFKVLFSEMNWNTSACPPKKGTFANEDFDPELGGFPVHFLPGFRLLLEVELYAQDISLMKCKAYLQVV